MMRLGGGMKEWLTLTVVMHLNEIREQAGVNEIGRTAGSSDYG